MIGSWTTTTVKSYHPQLSTLTDLIKALTPPPSWYFGTKTCLFLLNIIFLRYITLNMCEANLTWVEMQHTFVSLNCCCCCCTLHDHFDSMLPACCCLDLHFLKYLAYNEKMRVTSVFLHIKYFYSCFLTQYQNKRSTSKFWCGECKITLVSRKGSWPDDLQHYHSRPCIPCHSAYSCTCRSVQRLLWHDCCPVDHFYNPSQWNWTVQVYQCPLVEL